MLNKIWPLFLIVSIIYAIFSGNVESLSNGIFSYAGKDWNNRNNKKYFVNK